jgi:hypothetical protein
MKKTLIVSLAALTLLSGCSGAFWTGAGSGTAACGAAYELWARREMQRIEEDLEQGRVDQREYDIRKNQIERGSLFF